MRHILEIRLRRRLFSFMDFSGKMVEYITDELNTDQIRLQNNGARFDVADDKLENVYFFSIENFGFQTEMKTSFEDFTGAVKKLFDALKKFPDYKINDGLVRVGTKSIIFYHRKGDNIQTLKDAYKNLLVNNHEKLSELTKSSIFDTAHTIDLKVGNNKASVITGPATKEEALNKFFDGKIREKYREKITRENGLLLSIDVAPSSVDSLAIKDFETLEKQVGSQIQDISNVFEGFRTLFTESLEQ